MKKALTSSASESTAQPSSIKKEDLAPWVAIFLIVICAPAMLMLDGVPETLEAAFLVALGYFFGHNHK